jgi:hypothetical protein
MIELKDGLDWHVFQASFLPEEWYRRREGENVLKWIKRTAVNDSRWKDEAEERERNELYSEASSKITLAVISFLRQNNVKKEELEDLVGFELILNKQYDFRLSEIKKIEKVTGLCLLMKNI